ncbi:MAG: hypothetical protein R3362_07935, partial [Rhodothermales bacterium]|nr:hypothetical protein [Rhodothermales bacterium]
AYNESGGELDAVTMARMEAVARRPYAYLNPAFLSLRRRGGNDPERPDCRAVTTTVVISPFDELVLPCYHAGLEKLPIEGRLCDLWQSDRVAWHRGMEGRHAACRGCTINCYFEPSFAVTPTSGYFWESLPSKVRYVWTKFVVQRLSQRLGPKAARLPDLAALEALGTGGDGTARPADLIELPVLR